MTSPFENPATFPPSFASFSGEDEYGMYADLIIRDAFQRFRWIKPGSFIMCCGQDEPSGAGDIAAHRVELICGFWMADTVCSQHLFSAVVKGTREAPKRVFSPCYENLGGWTKFLKDLNSYFALRGFRGLAADLPTEAQWEYACQTSSLGSSPSALRMPPPAVFESADRERLGPLYCDQWERINAWGLRGMPSKYELCRVWYAPCISADIIVPQARATGPGRAAREQGSRKRPFAWLMQSHFLHLRVIISEVADLEQPPIISCLAPPILAPDCPPFANEVLADEYGYYADLRLGDVFQRMRWIPPGTFTMSRFVLDRPTREVPTRPVTLTKGFWLADTPCTKELYDTVLGASEESESAEGGQIPITNVNEGLFLSLLVSQTGITGFCLPTEAQWEHACRAGTSTLYSFGDILFDADDYMWREPRELRILHPVKLKKPNPWGLFDMYGNVGEACADALNLHRATFRGEPLDAMWVDPRGGNTGIRTWRGDPHCFDSAWNFPVKSVGPSFGFRIAHPGV